MKSILLRDLDAKTYATLKRLARIHHRSLQGELHTIIELAVKLAPPEDRKAGPSLVTVESGHKSSWRREKIYGN